MLFGLDYHDFYEIRVIARKHPTRRLALEWIDGRPAVSTTAPEILAAIKGGEYSELEFENYALCADLDSYNSVRGWCDNLD